MQTDLEQNLELEQKHEVKRRLAEIQNDPERLMRYDVNGDGIISDDEWEEVRRFVSAEVATEHARKREASKAHQPQNNQILEVLNDRYELIHVIGQGAQGKTFFGRDRQSGDNVAIKEMQMNQVEQWEAIDLFEREAQVLKNISHPAIPEFIDFFHTEADDKHGMRSFLVQEFVDGEDLKELMEAGLLIDESTARAFLIEMLGILDHLHNLPEPIIHSDIKLSNIIRRRDQRLALIDFGAVQFHTTDEELASNVRPTIIGTSGYMPIEQMMGRSLPATDLYALAATTVHLLSRRHPADLPLVGMAVQFQDFVNISDPFSKTLTKMLAPHVEHRFTSVREVVHALEQIPEPTPPETSASVNHPSNHQSTTVVNQHATQPRQHPTSIQFGRSTAQAPTFFDTWQSSTAPTERSQALDVPRPTKLQAELDDSDARFHLKFPKTNLSTIIHEFMALVITSAITLALFWTTFAAFADKDIISGLVILLLALAPAIPVVLIAKSLRNSLFNKISIEISDTDFHHHVDGLFGLKTSSIPLKTLETVTTTKLVSGSKNEHRTPIIKISNPYNVFYLGEGLSQEELDYWSAKIQQKLIEIRDTPTR